MCNEYIKYSVSYIVLPQSLAVPYLLYLSSPSPFNNLPLSLPPFPSLSLSLPPSLSLILSLSLSLCHLFSRYSSLLALFSIPNLSVYIFSPSISLLSTGLTQTCSNATHEPAICRIHNITDNH